MTLREMSSAVLDANLELPHHTGMILSLLLFLLVGIPAMFQHIQKLKNENPKKDYTSLLLFYIVLTISLLGFSFYTMTL